MEDKMIGLEDWKSGVEEGREGEEEDGALPGFRFHPTDEELVGFYLRRKAEKKPISMEIIKEIDIYKYDPWDLPRVSSTVGEKEWYFFCLRGRKYRNSIRPNRVTGSGFWKATGIDRPISSASSSGECIGLKKSLVYYQGSAGKGTKTQWMMHEYRLPSSPPFIQEAEIWTICRIIKRTNASFKKYTQQLSWKEANDSNQTPADSGSKTSSLESDGGREEKVLERAFSFQHGESYVGHNYMEETAGQLCASAGQYWNNSDADGYSSTLSSTSNVNEIFREGNWDEIGRMVDYLMETATTYETVYF